MVSVLVEDSVHRPGSSSFIPFALHGEGKKEGKVIFSSLADRIRVKGRKWRETWITKYTEAERITLM